MNTTPTTTTTSTATADRTPAAPWTWAALVALEPALAALEREARAVRALADRKRALLRHPCRDLLPPAVQRWAARECANFWWYRPGGLKERMSALVGYGARDERLRSSAAYDVAYDHLYRLLPDCRGCACA
jgi:hypothetical protein